MSSERLQSTTDSTRITNNDIRSMASLDLMSSKDILSSGSAKLQDSLEMEARAAEMDPLIRSSSHSVSSEFNQTIGSELSKTSKLTSSSPDCNIKSSSTSNGSSGGGAQREAFVASIYDEISPVGEFSATASPSHTVTTTPELSEREMECLATLMRLLATKKHPTNVHTATTFLMARKFDLVRTWGLYESHLQRRRKYRLDTLDPHEQPLRGELAKRKFVFLGTRDKYGRAIALFQANRHYPKQSNPLTVMQALSLHLDHALYDTTTQRQGIILIYNMSGSGVKNLDYDLAKELLDFLQEAYPARLHRTYVLNAPLWFRAAVRLFAPFLKKKVLERLQLVNLSELHAVLPPQSLPEQLGGALKFSYEDRLELCIAHWLMHPFSAIPPSLPNLTIPTNSNGNESLFSEGDSNREPSITRPPLPPKRASSQFPPTAFSPVTSVTDRIFSVPATPSSVDPVDKLVYQRQVPVLDEGDYQMTLEHLKTYVNNLGKRGLEDEYMKLRNIQPEGSFTNSVVPYNIGKNRYRDVLTFDHSRVRLKTINIEGDPDPHDYINANHIDSYMSPSAFIMCQGPIPNTVGDFWRMIWEQNVLNIVMVTRCTEGDRLKCAQYWPELAEGETKFNGIYVNPVDESPSRGFVIRRFSIRTTDTDSRDLTHFQYIAWPDYGVPENGDEVFHLMDTVQEEQAMLISKHYPDTTFTSPIGPPIVVHCSAGIGRSGTFCCIHSLIHQYHATGMVSVQGTVRKLRRQRAYSIQAPEQYSFIYTSIVEHMEKNPAGHADIPLPQVSIDVGATD